MHTSQVMSLLYNINRGKNGQSLGWEDFNPYEYERKKSAPAAKLTPSVLAKFGQMTKTLENGKKNGST